MKTVLAIENVHKFFKVGFIPKKKEILKGVSFRSPKAKSSAISGPTAPARRRR